MSDANEKSWSGKAGRPNSGVGMTRGASVVSGLSEHHQISDSTGINGHGQGQRPKKLSTSSMSHGGVKYRTR